MSSQYRWKILLLKSVLCVFKGESGSLFAGTLFSPSSHRKFSAGQKRFTQMSLPLCPWWEWSCVSGLWTSHLCCFSEVEWVNECKNESSRFILCVVLQEFVAGRQQTDWTMAQFPTPFGGELMLSLTDWRGCVCDEGLVDVYAWERQRQREWIQVSQWMSK